MIVIIVIIVVIMFILLCIIMRKETFKNTYNGMCVFDLDNTITCGLDNAKLAIDICKKNNYGIAINTARTSQYYSDINLDKLGLSEVDFINDFYYGKLPQCSFTDEDCFYDNIANTKIEHLYTLSKKWNLNPQKIILFDDVWNNIEKANVNGFSTVFANHQICGIPDNISSQLEKLMN